MKAWKASPAVRFWTRTIVVSAIGYLSTFFATVAVGSFSASSFLWGLGGAVFSGLAYALLGGTTPLEPFVGVKAKGVEVPSPPAVPDIHPVQ